MYVHTYNNSPLYSNASASLRPTTWLGAGYMRRAAYRLSIPNSFMLLAMCMQQLVVVAYLARCKVQNEFTWVVLELCRPLLLVGKELLSVLLNGMVLKPHRGLYRRSLG